MKKLFAILFGLFIGGGAAATVAFIDPFIGG